jgi:hypothetical protein
MLYKPSHEYWSYMTQMGSCDTQIEEQVTNWQAKWKLHITLSEERNVLTTQQHLLIAGARSQGDRVNNIPQQQIWTELVQGCYVHSIDGLD